MQSAFRPAHSAETALVRITNGLLCAVDMQQAVILILLDLSAALDTVDHNISIAPEPARGDMCLWGAAAVVRIVPGCTQKSNRHQQYIML